MKGTDQLLMLLERVSFMQLFLNVGLLIICIILKIKSLLF